MGKTGAFFGVLLFIGTGLGAVYFLTRGGSVPAAPEVVQSSASSNEEPSLPPSALLEEEFARREKAAASSRRDEDDRMMIASDPMTSELLQRGRTPPPDPMAENPALARPARRSNPLPSSSEDDEEAMKLSSGEQRQLDAVGAGVKTPEQAFALGKDVDLFASVLTKVGRFPKLTKYLLDNEYVVKGFMGRERNQRHCNNKQAAASFFSDPKASKSSLTVLNALLKGDSETPTAFAGSKLMNTMLECPAMKQLRADPSALSDIVQKNPLASQMLMDPSILKGMTASPELLNAYSDAQSGGR